MEKYLRIWALYFTTFLFVSCNSGKKSGSEETTPVDTSHRTDIQGPVTDTAINGCYHSVMGRDTAVLQLQVKGANITGTLLYDFYEKDRNDGTVQAEMNKDIVIGWYLFKSEGVLSVRQVAWKLVQQSLLPATGEMIQRNDTLLFKSLDKLEFDSKNKFVKTPCIM